MIENVYHYYSIIVSSIQILMYSLRVPASSHSHIFQFIMFHENKILILYLKYSLKDYMKEFCIILHRILEMSPRTAGWLQKQRGAREAAGNARPLERRI